MGSLANVNVSENTANNMLNSFISEVSDQVATCSQSAVSNQDIKVNVTGGTGNVDINGLNENSKLYMTQNCIQQLASNQDAKNKIKELQTQFAKSKAGSQAGISLFNVDVTKNLVNDTENFLTSISAESIQNCIQSSASNQQADILITNHTGNVTIKNVSLTDFAEDVNKCLLRDQDNQNAFNQYTQKLHQTAESVSQTNLIIIIVVVVAVVIIAIGIGVGVYYYKKKQQEKMDKSMAEKEKSIEDQQKSDIQQYKSGSKTAKTAKTASAIKSGNKLAMASKAAELLA